ncbi:MAG: GNAT family N-acetyltransferase [Pseudomonadota bacterium]
MFRAYASTDRDACLAIFDANCPEFFAANERDDYASFLDAGYAGYEVCEVDGKVAGAFGLMFNDDNEHRLNWIMLDPQLQGAGIGQTIMDRIIVSAREKGASKVGIAASHKSASFFAKFGAKELIRTEDGWGPGMHRVDMELEVGRTPSGTRGHY